MTWTIIVSILLAQIVAGTPEDKLFQRILAETKPEARLLMLAEFEKQFSQSKVLPDVYLMIIDIYRQRDDRKKIIEYGEKTLRADENNVTAMIVLSRNYALERKNIDRAIVLAEQAISRLGKMRDELPPPRYTAGQWSNYLQETEGSARSILEYARTVKGK